MSKSAYLALNSLQLVSRSRQLLEAEKELESAVKKSEAAAIELQKRTIDAEQREGRVAELDAKVQQEQVSLNLKLCITNRHGKPDLGVHAPHGSGSVRAPSEQETCS